MIIIVATIKALSDLTQIEYTKSKVEGIETNIFILRLNLKAVLLFAGLSLGSKVMALLPLLN